MTAKYSDGCAGKIAIVLVCVLGLVSVSFFRQSDEPAPALEAPDEGWNKGGTLHNKTAIDWQTAPEKDKLATCGEFFTTMWKNGNLSSKVASKLTDLDDAHPYVLQIVSELDSTFERRPDPEENRRFFERQSVSAGVMSVMFRKGWLKND